MSVDLAALVHSVRTLPDVRGCVLLSRDGLVLSADPASAEPEATDFWSHLGRTGDVERGFIKTDRCLWVFCQRGPYQAVVAAEPTARPGIILGALEQALLAGEQARIQDREDFRAAATPPDPPVQPARFRAPLHREPMTSEPPSKAAPTTVPDVVVVAQDAPPSPTEDRPGTSRPADTDWEVDVVQLAREFSGLYTEES
jgi:hypothetical protein